MANRENTPTAEEQPQTPTATASELILDFGGDIVEEYGKLLLAYRALGAFSALSPGYSITKQDTEVLDAIHSQVARVVARLDEIAEEMWNVGPEPAAANELAAPSAIQ